MMRPRSLGMSDPLSRGEDAGGAVGTTPSCNPGSPLGTTPSALAALSFTLVTAPSSPIATVAVSRDAPAAPIAGLPNTMKDGAGCGRGNLPVLPGGYRHRRHAPRRAPWVSYRFPCGRPPPMLPRRQHSKAQMAGEVEGRAAQGVEGGSHAGPADSPPKQCRTASGSPVRSRSHWQK